MSMQHIENMLRRYRGQSIDVKTMSGGLYQGKITEITNDYVALMINGTDGDPERVYVLLHSIESVKPCGGD